MTRYTDCLSIEGPPEGLFQGMKPLLEDWGFEITHLNQDYLIAREKPGDFPFTRLVTIELAAAALGISKVRVVVSNKAMPLQSNNHCYQMFRRVTDAIKGNQGAILNGSLYPLQSAPKAMPKEVEWPVEVDRYLNGDGGSGSTPIMVEDSTAVQPDPSPSLDDLETMTVGELTAAIEKLKQSINGLECLVREQEEELALHYQTVETLQTQMNTAGLFNDLDLEREIAEEQEFARMLDESLEGQRSRLREQQVVFSQHLSILQHKEAAEMT